MFKRVINAISRFRRLRKAKQNQLPMPGIHTESFMVGSIRVTKFTIGEEPEWVQELFADPTHPGPEPTYAELHDALFDEVRRLGIKIPE